MHVRDVLAVTPRHVDGVFLHHDRVVHVVHETKRLVADGLHHLFDQLSGAMRQVAGVPSPRGFFADGVEGLHHQGDTEASRLGDEALSG